MQVFVSGVHLFVLFGLGVYSLLQLGQLLLLRGFRRVVG